MEGLIRKIVVGKDPKNGMAYYLGMRAGTGKVSTIIQDERHLHKHSSRRYLVYLQEEDNSQVLWKAIEDAPCIIEFDLNF